MTETNLTAAESSVDANKKKSLFFYLKVLGVFAALIACSLLVSACYVFNKLSKDGNLEKIISRKASEITGLKAEFASVKLGLGGISIRDFAVATASEQLSFSARVAVIDVKPDLWAILGGNFVASSLNIASGTLDVKTPSLALLGNKKEAKKQQSPENGIDLSNLKLPFKALAFNNLHASVIETSTNKAYKVKLNSAELKKLVFSDAMPVSLKASVFDAVEINIDGYFYSPSKLKAKISLDGKNVSEIKALIPAELKKQFDFIKGAFASANIEYNLKTSALAVKNALLEVKPLISLKANSKKISLSPLELSLDVEAKAEASNLLKAAESFLSPEVKGLKINGGIAFNGSASYKQGKPLISGDVTSDKINVKETAANAEACVSELKTVLNNVGVETGVITVKSLKANCTGVNISAEGDIKNASDLGLNLHAKGSADLEEFSKYASSIFKLELKPKQFLGKIGIDIKVGGSVKAVKPKGTLTLKDVYLSLPSKGLYLNKLNGVVNADLDRLEIDKLTSELLGAKASIEGVLSNFKKPSVKAEFKMTGADLAQIKKLIKTNVPEMPSEIDFSGRSDLTLSLSGSTEKPQINGEATLFDARFFHPSTIRPINKINGPVGFSNTGITAKNVSAFWGTSKVAVNGQIKDWAKFITDFKYTINPLDAYDAAGYFLKDTGCVVAGIGKGYGTITGAIDKIKLSGTALIPQGKVNIPITEKEEVIKLPFNSLNINFNYYENVFSIASASLNIFRGKAKAESKIYLASDPLRFSFNANLSNLMSEDFMKLNTKYPNLLSGAVSGFCRGEGNTVGLVSFNADSALSLMNGTYNSPPIFKLLADKLNAPQLASGTINNLRGNYKIQNGRIHSDDTIASSGKYGRVKFKGSVGLDTTLNGTAGLVLNKSLCLKSNVLKPLIGQNDTLEIPVGVKGTFASPVLSLSLEKLAKKAAKEQIKNKVADSINEFLSKNGLKSEGNASDSANAGVASGTQENTKEAEAKKQILQRAENKLKSWGKSLEKRFKRIF